MPRHPRLPHRVSLLLEWLDDRNCPVAGGLDPTFGTGGLVVTDFSSTDDNASDVVVQADGKIVVAGTVNGNFAVARYLEDGSLDSSFGIGGRQATDLGGTDTAEAIALQSDGKIIVVGTSGSDMALIRYDVNGILDGTFGVAGIRISDFGATDVATAVAIQNDDMIVIGGYTGSGDPFYGDFLVARYDADGTALDTSGFGGGDGFATADFAAANDIATSLAIQADGRIVVAGFSGNQNFGWYQTIAPHHEIPSTLSFPNFNQDYDFAVARFTASGLLDNTFAPFGATPGQITTDIQSDLGPPSTFPPMSGIDLIFDIALQADGKIVVAGATGARVPYDDGSFNDGPSWFFALARYDSDGTADSTFDGDGQLFTTFRLGPRVMFKPDGWGVARSVAIQDDGKIVAAGWAHPWSHPAQFAAVRYRADGSLDPTFSGGRVLASFATGNEDLGRAMEIQPDGDIVIAGTVTSGGTRNFGLARLKGSTTVIATGSGRDSTVRVFEADGTPLYEFLAYGSSFKGGVRVAVGDVNGDGNADIVTVPGAGRKARVKAYLGDGLGQFSFAFSFDPFGKTYTAGAYVAVSDVFDGGDGRDEIVISRQKGPGRIKVRTGDNSGYLANFPTGFSGGAVVATGNVAGDSLDEIIAMARGANPVVALFSGLGAAISSFSATGIQANSWLAVGNVLDDDEHGEIVIGWGSSGSVTIFEPSGTFADSFAAYLSGPVRVAVADLDRDGVAEIITGPGSGQPAQARIFAAEGSLLDDFFVYDPIDANYTKGLFVAG